MDITYLGSFDDRAIAYGQAQNLNILTLNEILFSELLFSNNSSLVVNDGYIIHSPILVEALMKEPPLNSEFEDFHYQQSPLFSMLQNKRVTVLSRNENLMGMIEMMLKENNGTFAKYAKRKD